MLRLRPYKTCDAHTIVTWCSDEVSLRRWSSDRYDTFPITAADMNHKYVDCNGDCGEPDNFYPMTAFDDSGVVGHLIMRFTDEQRSGTGTGAEGLSELTQTKGEGCAPPDFFGLFSAEQKQSENICVLLSIIITGEGTIWTG